MNIIDWIVANWFPCLIALIIIAGITVLIIRKEWGKLKTMLFALVTTAEQEFGPGTGKLKFAAVFERLAPHIMTIIKLFIPNEKIEELIEKALEVARQEWEKNPKLLTPETMSQPPQS